jgi:hypothetical protein
MNLFIKYIDGQIYDHPISRVNLLSVYPEYDFIEFVHPDYIRFERVPPPDLGPYQTGYEHEYEFYQDRVRDRYVVNEMTEQERQQKIESYIEQNPKPYPSWYFDESMCRWQAPVRPPINEVTLYFQRENLLAMSNRYQVHVLPSWDEDLQRWSAYMLDTQTQQLVEIICDATGVSITPKED